MYSIVPAVSSVEFSKKKNCWHVEAHSLMLLYYYRVCKKKKRIEEKLPPRTRSGMMDYEALFLKVGDLSLSKLSDIICSLVFPLESCLLL